MIPRTLDSEILDELASASGPSLVSLFIPTHSRGRDVSQDRIRLKNQLSAAERILEALGRKPRERKARLASARELLDDREFWEHQSAGLAVYITEDGELTALSLADGVEAATVVMPVFQLRPLLRTLQQPSLSSLALTRDRVELFIVERDEISRSDVDLPESMEDVNWFVDRERQRQQHPDRAGSSRNRHGQEPSGRSEEDLNRFLREVISALPEADDGSPLAVLGDDDLVARFANLTDREVISPADSGLSSDFGESQVHSATLPLLDEISASREQNVVEDARSAIGVGRAVSDLASAVPDAASGRIGRLVIDPSASSVWGRFDSTDYSVTVHEERNPADVDLLDRLFTLAVETGAEVVPVDGELLGSDFVAIRRF